MEQLQRTPRILVIDDNRMNLELAKKQLGSSCDLTFTSTFSGAKEHLFLGKCFDAVFTDVMLIGERTGIRKDHPDIGAEVPYGLIIAMLAKNKGVENVVLVTDLNHHSGAIAFALDTLKTSEGHVICIGSKDWGMAYRACFGTLSLSGQHDLLEQQPLDWLLISNDFTLGNGNRALQHWSNMLPQGEDALLVPTKASAELQHTFIMRNPKRTLLIGELSNETDTYDIKEEFALLRRIKVPGQQIMVAGWLDIKDEPCYLRLPFTPEQLIKKFDEAR